MEETYILAHLGSPQVFLRFWMWDQWCAMIGKIDVCAGLNFYLFLPSGTNVLLAAVETVRVLGTLGSVIDYISLSQLYWQAQHLCIGVGSLAVRCPV